MSSRSACHQETLADGNVGFIALCSCGSVHVGLGPLTLRIDPGAFLAFAALVVEARERLVHRVPALVFGQRSQMEET